MRSLGFIGCVSPRNTEFSEASSQPPLTDSKWSPAFNLVPLQMSGRQRASSVTAIDQALFSTAAPTDRASQGPCTAHQSRTSQPALTGCLRRMPSLSAQPMSFTHIITMTWQMRAKWRVVVPWGDPVANASRRGPMMQYDGLDSLARWRWWGWMSVRLAGKVRREGKAAVGGSIYMKDPYLSNLLVARPARQHPQY